MDDKDATFPEKLFVGVDNGDEKTVLVPFSLLGTVNYYHNNAFLLVAVYFIPGWPIKRTVLFGVILILVIVIVVLCLRRSNNDDGDDEEDEEDIDAVRPKKNLGTSGGAVSTKS